MTEHSIATMVDIFPDEFQTLIKVINHSIHNELFTEDEKNILIDFKDNLVDKCL